ncbi:acyltransferase family protein [Sphingomonas endolithica]|uniref:acyltransferase family protein n=1 Tax=Sphingomonas endolithica TaxID=2972485 RepID=UPI0021AEDCD8|nr:acyltransferase family protein [Sphingomonas sp. ZFBP2030]
MRNTASSGYRPDIDGLRTLAVLPVVLFHAGIPYVTGGFIGVDVFFVISGFLITGIIAREISERRFSILEFYRRRARRIFPALTAVVLTTILIGYLVLTPKEYVALGGSAVSIAVFSSNFYFWKSVSYFDPGIQPLLHTWSLAVEEQYYLFFPILFLVMHKRKNWMVAALWTVLIGSLALSAALVAIKPSAAFYLLPSRAWELMLGGLLAMERFGGPSSDREGKLASLAGYGLILVPVFAYTPSTPFPGLAALPPVLGAALLIWGRGWGLSSRWMVRIGLLSYSLYLWHLPVIDFARYLTDAPLSPLGGLMASVVSLALAALTYRYVETPFRVGRNKPRLAAQAALGMPLLAALALVVVFTAGAPSRLLPLQSRQLAVQGDEARHPSRCMTIAAGFVDPAKPCQFGERPSVLLWGDSHAMVTATSMEAAGVPFLFAADADCPIGLGLSIDASHAGSLADQTSYQRCGEYNANMFKRALQPDVKTVVLSSRWTNWRIGEPANPSESSVDLRLVDATGTASSTAGNRSKFEKAFTALLDRLIAAGKNVVIVGPMPEPSYNVPHRLFVGSFGLAPAPKPAEYFGRHSVALTFLRSVEKRKGVSMIWPAMQLCRSGICPTTANGMPLYFDHNHLTVDASRSLAPLYVGLRPPKNVR